MSRDDDIVDYLLGELAPDDRARVERAMRDDPSMRAEVERMRPLVADLEGLPAEAWGGDAPVPPLAPLPPLPAAEPPAPARRRIALRPAFAVVGALAVLALGIAIGALAGGDDPPSGPALALARVGDAAPGASGVARLVSDDGGSLGVRVRGLPTSAAAQFYELWLLDGPGRAISLGSFRVPASGAADITVPVPVALTDFRFIDISVEAEDGDATHSGRSVLRAPTGA